MDAKMGFAPLHFAKSVSVCTLGLKLTQSRFRGLSSVVLLEKADRARFANTWFLAAISGGGKQVAWLSV